MLVLAVMNPAVCWGYDVLHTCMKQYLLDQESCDSQPDCFQSWKLAADSSEGRKVTLSPPCSCHPKSLPLKA